MTTLRQRWHQRFGHRWGMPSLGNQRGVDSQWHIAVTVTCPCQIIRVRWLDDTIPDLCDTLWQHHERELHASYERVFHGADESENPQ
jgi:hypothetical protein